MGFQQVESAGPGLHFVRGLFHLGEGQREGLKWKGLRDRLISLLDDGLNDARLRLSPENESTASELEEERAMVKRLIDGEELPFVLDTTMAIASTGTRDGNDLALISPTPYDQSVHEQIKKIGTVRAIVANNLQHWLFLPKWASVFPNATIYLAPPALGEDLTTKVKEYATDTFPQSENQWVILTESGTQIGPNLSQQLLQGAPLNMNEIVFFHKPSKTLIASDSFYGGYTKNESPSWFARIWFKLTKSAFRSTTLPIYRTSRVLTNGDKEKLLNCVDDICKRWEFKQIIFAHGTSPYTEKAREKYREEWSVLNTM